MIIIKNLTKDYKLDDQHFEALDDINLEITPGEFVVVLGQSGCGKSTLLNLLGGMDKPTAGHVLVDNKDLSKLKSDELARYRREIVGMIFQKFNLISDMTVLENVMLPLKFSGLSEKEQKKLALKAIKDVNLSEKAKSVPTKLSGGQQQRVAIARSLVNNPKILLCDEPTGNLDSKTGTEIFELLHSLNDKGHTIIMVTHNEQYAQLADRVIKMLDGKVLEEKTQNKKSIGVSLETKKTKTLNFLASVKLALKNINRRKFRVFLTSFGISIGAMAILVLVSFGAGLQNEATKQLKAYNQVNQITVSSSKIKGANFRSDRINNFVINEETPLNDQIISDFKKINNVKNVYPVVRIDGEMSYQGKTGLLSLQNIPPLGEDQGSVKDHVKYGRYFASDSENSVIVPYGLAQALGFDNGADIVNKEVTIQSSQGNQEIKATVIGVFDENQKDIFQSYMPNDTATGFLKTTMADELKKPNPSLYNSVTVISKDNASVTGINQTLIDKGYSTHNYADTAKEMNRIFLMLQVGLGIIGAIAMFVASLGIINTMMMSILERTREIGVMKAIGARARDIKSVFLTEASLIGFFGGFVGLGLGYPGSQIASVIFNKMLTQNGGGNGEIVKFYVAPYLALGVLLFSILIAIIAGFFPANRGANLDPVIALRED